MKNIYVISHSHWDREWYMPFEHHRKRLIELMDTAMDLFENDPDFKCFFLDGQTIVLEDYLEIKPYNRQKLESYIKEGRFFVGPWYVLQDEYLTSSESNIRNLLVGMDMAQKAGGLSHVGYFPDSFGNVGQMPQILNQAGMKAIVFGRGVKPIGMDNTVIESNEYSSMYSEMYWQSPDGSKLPSILLATWYNNGGDIPPDGNKEYWDKKIEAVSRFASTDNLLLMNGSDHQPVDTDLSTGLNNARKNYPEYNFIHSDLETYATKVTENLPDNVATVCGELTSQHTDGWYTLANTASSHQRLKTMNRRGEILLESIAEPLSVIASELGAEFPRDMLLYSWKTLMQNHPHDSICGCSVDAVNDEMRTRFLKSSQAAETIVNDSLEFISKQIPTNGFDGCDAMFAVINTCGNEKSGMVSVNVDVKRNYFTVKQVAVNYYHTDNELEDYILIDADGNEIPCRLDDYRTRFAYDLPNDRFREPYIAKTVTVTFNAENVPAMGYKAFALKKGTPKKKHASLVTAKNTMENEFLKVSINNDGTVNILDKVSGNTFSNLLRYEDVGDCGNEYTFVPVKDDTPILSGDIPADIELVSDNEFVAEYRITTTMDIPAWCGEKGEEEIRTFVMMQNRAGSRSEETIPTDIHTFITLEKNSRKLKVRTEFENHSQDHRLRVLFPTGIKTETHKAGSVFDSVERNNKHADCWTYPSGCERQQEFMLLNNSEKGMCISNIGLYEYEITNDDTVAITLVRAVSELGDWGVFRTELSQCQYPICAEYEIIPFTDEADAIKSACELQYPFSTVQITKHDSNAYKNNNFIWNGKGIRMTAFKKAQKDNDIIVRWVNYSNSEQTLTIDKTTLIDNLYKSNVIEEKGDLLTFENDKCSITVKPHEILTLGIRR